MRDLLKIAVGTAILLVAVSLFVITKGLIILLALLLLGGWLVGDILLD